MRPVTVSVTGPGSSTVIPVDIYQTTAIGMGVIIGPGVVTDCAVQHTFDDIWDVAFNPATATWFDHPTLAGLSSNADGNYAQPPRGVRLTIVAGAGTATLKLVQAGVMG